MGNNNDLAYFTDSINTLIEGQLIMVNKNIASVLRCIAGSEILCKCLSETPDILRHGNVACTRNLD